jgi:protein SCO1/2
VVLAIGIGSSLLLKARDQRPQLGGDFTLSDINGPISLSDFRGQAVVMMFGYTSCPDVCPTGLSNLASALDRLSKEEQKRIQPLFISVDPDRDSPQRLLEYCRYFHPSLIGLTGTQQQIDPVVQAYGAFYRKVELQNSAMEYSVDHSARIYLIDTRGSLSQLLYHDTPPQQLAEALRKLILKI